MVVSKRHLATTHERSTLTIHVPLLVPLPIPSPPSGNLTSLPTPRYPALSLGNLATASPISDMSPLLAACGAEVVLNSVEGKERRVKVRDFFTE